MTPKMSDFRVSLKKYIIERTLSDFNEYSGFLEKHCNQLYIDLDNKIKAEMAIPKSEEEESFFQAYIEDEYIKIGREYPQMLRRLILLSIYSFCDKESHGEINKLKGHEIELIKYIRHFSAHNNGMLDDKDPRTNKIKEYAKETPGISTNEYHEIVIEPEYIERIITVFKEYFNNYLQNQADI